MLRAVADTHTIIWYFVQRHPAIPGGPRLH